MARASADPRLDKFFSRATQWKAEMGKLREILRRCELTEDFKWGKPCYTFEGSNIAIIQPMKAHLALMFFKGALIPDPAGALEKQGPSSQSARRLVFTSVREVERGERALKRIVREAIRVEKSGLKVEKTTELVLVEELTKRLARDPALAAAFEGLTPGRRRAYNLHFSDAKQSSTREKRIDKYVAKILRGKGLQD